MTRSRTVLLTTIAVASLLATTGCARKGKVPEQRLGVNAFGKDSSGQLAGGLGGSMSGSGWNAAGGAPGAFGDASGVSSSLAGMGGFGADAAGGFPQSGNVSPFDAAIAELEMVHFAYDQADIAPEWQTVLDNHAQWLASNPAVAVQVEGHCDERGTEEYNLALGQRRADAIRDYLINRGVSPDRITTISYGKLRPLTFGTTEDEHNLNRRGMFLVYSPGTEVAGF